MAEELEQFTGDPTIENIIAFVAKQHVMTSEDIIARSRKAHRLEALFDAVAMVYTIRRDLSLTDIGLEFGNRGYAAISNALKHRDIDVPISGIIDREAIIKDAKRGISIQELAHKHHCSRPSVRKILYEAKLPVSPRLDPDQNFTLPDTDRAETKSSPKS